MYELAMVVFLAIPPAVVLGSLLHAISDTGGARWHFNTSLLLSVPVTIAMFLAMASDGTNPSNASVLSIIFVLFLGPIAMILALAFYIAGRLRAPGSGLGYDVLSWVAGSLIVATFAFVTGMLTST